MRSGLKLKNGAGGCAECKFMKMYDYGRRIYYCDHEGRIDDMGKLSVGELPNRSPEWCPLRDKSNDNTSDLIKMQSDILLVDKDGNPIEVKAIQPEYISDIFS